jgi:thioredoxin reductase
MRHQYIVIGAGPAGLQMAYFFQKEGVPYLLLERGNEPGAFFTTYPRHRRLISINKLHTGHTDPETQLRWDWNSLLTDDPELAFSEYSQEYFPHADRFVAYLQAFATAMQMNIRYRQDVRRIAKRDGLFHVSCACGSEYEAERVIVATGMSKPYIPRIPGIETAETYGDVNIEPSGFRGERVLIIGKGNSAFELADSLIGEAAAIHLASPNPVRLAWQTHYVGDLRAVNNNFLDTYQLKSQNAVLDCVIENIERRDDSFAVKVRYSHAESEVEQLIYDRVVACTGFRFDASIFDESCAPQLDHNDRLPRQTAEWEAVGTEGLFFAGTITQQRDYQVSTSAFIHGFRYNVRALYRMLREKYDGAAWPSKVLEATPAALTAEIIRRINRTSALWQQFGFLADLIVVDDEQNRAIWYEEMPVDYCRSSAHTGLGNRHFLLTLEYGPQHRERDPFRAGRVPRTEVARAEQSSFLHPVLREYAGDKMESEHHVIEDLAAEWREPEHVEPLLSYLSTRTALHSGARAMRFGNHVV